MLLLIIFLCIALGFSFLCSIAEAVLLSVTVSYLPSLKSRRVAERLRDMKENIDRPLAAILSLNTIAHTVGATGVGAQAVAVFGDAWVGVISGVLTLLILVLSEIIPKTVGARYWRSLAPSVSAFVEVLVWLMFPFVLLSELLTRVISGNKRHESMTREEFEALADIGAEEGHLKQQEYRIVKNLLNLQALRVSDIMTPRPVVISWSQDLTVSEALDSVADLPVSRIPIFGDGVDDVIGFVLKTDLLLAHAAGKGDTKISEYRRPLRAIRDNVQLSALFELLLGSRSHIAVVIDQYGSNSGVVTLEDLIETLIGMEIVDEADQATDMQKVAREHWRKRATRLGLPDDREAEATAATPAISEFTAEWQLGLHKFTDSPDAPKETSTQRIAMAS